MRVLKIQHLPDPHEGKSCFVAVPIGMGKLTLFFFQLIDLYLVMYSLVLGGACIWV